MALSKLSLCWLILRGQTVVYNCRFEETESRPRIDGKNPQGVTAVVDCEFIGDWLVTGVPAEEYLIAHDVESHREEA